MLNKIQLHVSLKSPLLEQVFQLIIKKNYMA
jgi:hypothetical protein